MDLWRKGAFLARRYSFTLQNQTRQGCIHHLPPVSKPKSNGKPLEIASHEGLCQCELVGQLGTTISDDRAQFPDEVIQGLI